MYDVVALGELLIDFSPYGYSKEGNPLFERNPGGAPTNVLMTVSKFGKKTAFIGKVGEDQFGQFLTKVLNDNKIDTQGLISTDSVPTTLAFVHLKNNGERSFSFYRKPGADLTLKKDEVNYSLLDSTRWFHFGSVSMTDEPSRTATLSAVSYAKRRGIAISYDPNLREPLWTSLREAKRTISEGLYFTDILKISEEELFFLTEESDLIKGTQLLYSKYNISFIFVTLGEKGCFFKAHDSTGMVSGFRVKSIDTTGAGDAFLGAIIYKFLNINKAFSQLTSNEMKEMVIFANATGAITTTKKGAIPALPYIKQVQTLINNYSE
jgi:fructokinase